MITKRLHNIVKTIIACLAIVHTMQAKRELIEYVPALRGQHGSEDVVTYHYRIQTPGIRSVSDCDKLAAILFNTDPMTIEINQKSILGTGIGSGYDLRYSNAAKPLQKAVPIGRKKIQRLGVSSQALQIGRAHPIHTIAELKSTNKPDYELECDETVFELMEAEIKRPSWLNWSKDEYLSVRPTRQAMLYYLNGKKPCTLYVPKKFEASKSVEKKS